MAVLNLPVSQPYLWSGLASTHPTIQEPQCSRLVADYQTRYSRAGIGVTFIIVARPPRQSGARAQQSMGPAQAELILIRFNLYT